MNAFSAKPKAKPPCRCGAYTFPHRASAYCRWHEERAEQEKIDAQDHARDLRAWANLSRG